MAAGYRPVQWNANKVIYDLVLWSGIVLFAAGYLVIGTLMASPENPISEPILVIRVTGLTAFTMLTIILMIGPLARLDTRFLPLLYNRRHFGVSLFLVLLVHAGVVLTWYHGFGKINPFVSLLSGRNVTGGAELVSFEILGVAAFLILFVLAATSHDFWLNQLSAPIWKALHMGVYVAYALVIGHVALGFVQAESSPLHPAWVGAGLALVAGLQLAAGLKGANQYGATHSRRDGWIKVCPVADIPQNRAKIVNIAGADRAAVFRYGDRISAVGNACRHQNGPLGEGRIVDGCITCPWHGYQYDPATGRAPPPFTEKIPTYRVKVENGIVWLHPEALPPGTPVTPATV